MSSYQTQIVITLSKLKGLTQRMVKGLTQRMVNIIDLILSLPEMMLQEYICTDF